MRNLLGCRMHLGIGCTIQPGKILPLEYKNVNEDAATQKIVFLILDYVFNLSFFMSIFT